MLAWWNRSSACHPKPFASDALEDFGLVARFVGARWVSFLSLAGARRDADE